MVGPRHQRLRWHGRPCSLTAAQTDPGRDEVCSRGEGRASGPEGYHRRAAAAPMIGTGGLRLEHVTQCLERLLGCRVPGLRIGVLLLVMFVDSCDMSGCVRLTLRGT